MMSYTLIIIALMFLLYFIFIYDMYLQHNAYMIEQFDANHCPNTKEDTSTNSMEINSSQYIQNEKRLNNEALVGFYKHHRGISWVAKPFLDNYYYNNPPTRTPGILIWCFATWITWIPKISSQERCVKKLQCLQLLCGYAHLQIMPILHVEDQTRWNHPYVHHQNHYHLQDQERHLLRHLLDFPC